MGQIARLIIHAALVKHTKELEALLHELDNSMNECCCEDRKAFNFCNVSTEVEAPILCVNCGGYIEPKDFF